MQVNPYLNFDGRCEEAFKFYEQCLGGKVECILRYSETPMAEQISPEWKNKVIHSSLKVGDQVKLMGTDCPPEHFQKAQGISVTLGIKDLKDAERIFQALSEDANITMPFQKTFWSSGFGMLVDRYGTPWMVNCEERPA